MNTKEPVFVDPAPETKQMPCPVGSLRPFAVIGKIYLVIAAALPICWGLGLIPTDILGYCEGGALVATFGAFMMMASVCCVKEEQSRLEAALAAPVMTLKELMAYEGRRVRTYSRDYPILRCEAEEWLHVDKDLFAFARTRYGHSGWHDGGDGYSYCGFKLDLTDFAIWLEKHHQEEDQRKRARENLLKDVDIS